MDFTCSVPASVKVHSHTEIRKRSLNHDYLSIQYLQRRARLFMERHRNV